MTILHLMEGRRMHDARRLKGPVAFVEGMSAENSKSQIVGTSDMVSSSGKPMH